jgi:hypothetical protein
MMDFLPAQSAKPPLPNYQTLPQLLHGSSLILENSTIASTTDSNITLPSSRRNTTTTPYSYGSSIPKLSKSARILIP